MNALWRSFAGLAQGDPSARAVRRGPAGAWLTLGDLRRRAEELGSDLVKLGLRRGSVCAVEAESHPGFIVAVLAVWSRDAVVLPLEAGLPAGEAGSAACAFGAGLLLRTARGRPLVERLAPGAAARHPGAAMIRMTSGSTGSPRGALLTAGQITADGRAIIARMGIAPGDLNVAVLPLGHSYGFDNLVVPLLLQGTPLVLLDRPLPSLILRALRARRPTILPVVPYLVDLLVRHADGPLPGTSLKLCISAGAPLPGATARAFLGRFGVPVHAFYGASEAGGITFDGDPSGAIVDGRVGTPLPGVSLTIERRGLGRLPAGEGRVVVRGPAVALGYVPSDPADLAGGRFRTSDLGRLDAEGRLHLTGRLSGLVNVSGKKVNPAEVERLLRDLDGIEDAAVLGVPDPLRGERVEAWVVGSRFKDTSIIHRALSARLTAWKVPRAIHLVASIPRTARGKVDRLRLLDDRGGSRQRSRPRSRP